MTANVEILVWLEWPERCFRAEAEEMRFLRSLAAPGARVVRARSERAFLAALPRATHAIVWRFKKEWYARAKRLRVLATPGAGRELVAWRDAPAGVAVHFGGFHGAIISEAVAGFVLAWAHGFFRPELRAADAAGSPPWRAGWPRVALGDKCSLVAGTRAVVAGYGKIGRAIGAKLEALGVEVKGISRGNVAELDAAAKTADWFVMALPSDTGTDGFLSRRLIAKLPRRCVVVNIGRGNAVDEAALVAALEKGRIAGAYLDVFNEEPGPLAGMASAVFDCLSFECLSQGRGSRKKASRLDSNTQTPKNSNTDILGTVPGNLPDNLIKMPHSSAFCGDYLKMCFKELKNEGLI